MELPFPPHAEKVTLGGEGSWLWRSQHGWNVLQGPYQVDVENVERNGQRWHTIDWTNRTPRNGDFEGGLAEDMIGHLDRAEFLQKAEAIVESLRRRDAPPAV